MGVDDELILAVFAKPVLYNVTMKEYRDRIKKDIAWRRTSEEVGLSVDICKKWWKSLRDTYMKERRKAKEKRSGSAVLTFLDRFISPRETSGNMTRVEEMQASDDRPEEQEEAAGGLSEVGDTIDEDRQSPLPELPAAAASSSSSEQVGPSAAPTDPSRKRARKRPAGRAMDFEQELLLALQQKTAPRAQTEDEHFLVSASSPAEGPAAIQRFCEISNS
ncbi:hypothetical protein WMY93_011258 [Mugilogobius chulae]|uniref:MADF domain-containing protein n=1 Tax=Mugilogobius chulae TaxID=88201 RepID=A0AAW0P5H3_9GOBI